jgi:ribonuclease P protein component
VDDAARLACLGAVVPKRLARRAVTRNTVRRLIREAASRAEPPLRRGLWVVRLRTAIDRQRFPSARSDALVTLLRSELAGLFAPTPRA